MNLRQFRERCEIHEHRLGSSACEATNKINQSMDPGTVSHMAAARWLDRLKLEQENIQKIALRKKLFFLKIFKKIGNCYHPTRQPLPISTAGNWTPERQNLPEKWTKTSSSTITLTHMWQSWRVKGSRTLVGRSSPTHRNLRTWPQLTTTYSGR